MKTRLLTTLVAAAALVAVACAPQGSRTNTEIPLLSDTWESSFNAGDLDALVDLYVEDARLLAPNEGLTQGRDAVRAAFSEMIAEGLQIRLDTVEAVSAGDIGTRVGTYAVLAPDGATVDRGKFIDTWRRSGDQWRITNDIWNSDLPCAEEGETVIASHDVEDPGRWLAAWEGEDGRRADFLAHGGASVRVFQSPDHPEHVALLLQVVDVDALRSWVGSPEGARAKAEDGVIDSTLRFLHEVD